MREVTQFVAFDDTTFETREACVAYEAKQSAYRLVGLTIEVINAAIAGDYPELAQAIKDIGNRIARARRARGDLKRAPNKKAEAPVAAADEPPEPIEDSAE